MQGIGDEEDMKEDIEIEESEKEIYNKKAIKATKNRPAMEEINREGRLFSSFSTHTNENDDENENDDDNGEIDEIEEGDSDGVFEEQSKNISNIEKNEKDKEVEENEGEKTCGKNNEQKKGKIDPCGECSKPVKGRPWGGVQCKICKVWRHWKTECSGLHEGYSTPARVVENKFVCQSCAKEIAKAGIENNINQKGKVAGGRKGIEKKPVRGRGRRPSVFDKTTIITGGTLPNGGKTRDKEGTTDPKRGKTRDREGTSDPKDNADRSPKGKKA